MLVTDIEISHYRYCSHTARHMANVCLTLKDQIVTLLCQIDLPQDEETASRARAFVADATRQLRRMPEFRSGKNTLQFSGHLSDDAQLQIA